MKILASDYDGTLCIDGVVRNETLKAINKWREAGNQFGIITGRDIRMTKDVIYEHNIPVDFVICNNGCVLYNESFEEIFSNYIPSNIVHQLIESSTIARSSYIVLADEVGRYVYDNEFDKEKYTEVYYTEVLNADNIKDQPHFYQMDTRYKDAIEMQEVSTMLEDEFSSCVNINPNVTTIDLTPLGVNKLTGLQKYIQLNKLNESKIITVGDGLNDLAMIEYFNGYTMKTASEGMKKRVKHIVEYVEDIIDKEMVLVD